MTLLALVLSVLTGFQVTWNVEPAREQEGGTVHMTVHLDEEDLLFLIENGSEVASWEVAAVIDGELTVRNSGLVIKSELPVNETLSILNVPTGSHLLTVIVRDLETGRSYSWEEEIEVPLMDSAYWSSGSLQILEGTTQRASGSTEVVWYVYAPSLPNEPDSLNAAYVLRDASGVTRREGWMNMTASGISFEYTVSIDINDLDAGEYEILTVVVYGDEIVAASGKRLDILQSWDVWGEDPDLTRKLIRPIASSAELRALADAEGPSSKNAVMAEFWHRRDPSPGTVRNESLEEYLIRLDYIEDHFSVLNKMGINTDRGRVYVLLGEPDISENRPLENFSLPSQTWTYFTPPLEVSFVDYDGYGEFELYTEWEEVRNAWERHRIF